MTIEMKCRLEGTKQQYWTLKVFKDGQDLPEVHTSKNQAYLLKIRREYETGIRAFRGSHSNSVKG